MLLLRIILFLLLIFATILTWTIILSIILDHNSIIKMITLFTFINEFIPISIIHILLLLLLYLLLLLMILLLLYIIIIIHLLLLKLWIKYFRCDDIVILWQLNEIIHESFLHLRIVIKVPRDYRGASFNRGAFEETLSRSTLGHYTLMV